MCSTRSLFRLLGCGLGLAFFDAANAAEVIARQYSDGPGLVAQVRRTFAISTSPPESPLLPGRSDSSAARDGTRPAPAVTLNLYQALDPRWTLQASAGWQERFRPRPVEAESPLPLASRGSGRDAWHVAVATQYRVAPEVLWQARVAYDSRVPSTHEPVFAMLPTSSWHLAAGLSYALEKDSEFNFNYSYVRLGDISSEQARGSAGIGTAGEFSHAGVHVVSFSVIWRY